MKERQKSKGEEEQGKGEKEMRECGRKAGRANERRAVYLATGGTYRSICAQPLSTQTAYVDTQVPIPPPLPLLPPGATAVGEGGGGSGGGNDGDGDEGG